MAWMSSGRTNEELIDRMMANGLIKSPLVAEAMKKVDRKHYCPDPKYAYEDSPQRIGYNATISAPHMHAHAAENLLSSLPAADFKGGAILDVGSGSGYLTAVFHHLAPHATVIGIEHIEGLVEQSRKNLRADGVKLGDGPGGVQIIQGDGREGSPRHAPFQVIHVGAAAPTIPQPLIDQLATPGRMFIPVGDESQDIWQIDKLADGSVIREKLFGVRYVPLCSARAQWPQ